MIMKILLLIYNFMHNRNPLALLQKQSRLDDEPLELERVKESLYRKTQTFFTPIAFVISLIR